MKFCVSPHPIHSLVQQKTSLFNKKHQKPWSFQKLHGFFAYLSYLRRKYSDISYNFCAIWDKRVKKSLPIFNSLVLFETIFASKFLRFCIVWYKNTVFFEILY